MFANWGHPTIGVPTVPVSAVILAHDPKIGNGSRTSSCPRRGAGLGPKGGRVAERRCWSSPTVSSLFGSAGGGASRWQRWLSGVPAGAVACAEHRGQFLGIALEVASGDGLIDADCPCG